MTITSTSPWPIPSSILLNNPGLVQLHDVTASLCRRRSGAASRRQLRRHRNGSIHPPCPCYEGILFSKRQGGAEVSAIVVCMLYNMVCGGLFVAWWFRLNSRKCVRYAPQIPVLKKNASLVLYHSREYSEIP